MFTIDWPSRERKRLDPNDYLIFDTSKRERIRMIRKFIEAKDEKATQESIEEVWQALLDEVVRKLKPLGDELCGRVSLKFTKPRPIRITYEDTGEVVEFETIPQLAIVGTVYDDFGTKAVLKQNWVGRVFPQWKCFVA